MNQQPILLILFIVVIAVTAYMFFQDAPDQTVLAADPAIRELEARLVELRRINTISFDTSVLKDNFFRSLDLPPIPPPPDIKIGRANPFIPF